MKTIDEMQFYCEAKSGKYVGRVTEFRDLRSSRKSSRLDALDEIIALTSERLREIECGRGDVAGTAWSGTR